MRSSTNAKSKQATERLEVRMPAPIKALVVRAAALEGRTLTDFVIATLQKNAAEVVQEHEVLRLSVENSEAFAAAMLGAPEPKRNLRQALARHQNGVTIGERFAR